MSILSKIKPTSYLTELSQRYATQQNDADGGVSWKNLDYSKGVTQSARSSLSSVKKSLSRGSLGIKTHQRADAGKMADIQDVMDDIAKGIGLFGKFSAKNIQNAVEQAEIYKETVKGDKNAEAAEELLEEKEEKDKEEGKDKKSAPEAENSPEAKKDEEKKEKAKKEKEAKKTINDDDLDDEEAAKRLKELNAESPAHKGDEYDYGDDYNEPSAEEKTLRSEGSAMEEKRKKRAKEIEAAKKKKGDDKITAEQLKSKKFRQDLEKRYAKDYYNKYENESYVRGSNILRYHKAIKKEDPLSVAKDLKKNVGLVGTVEPLVKLASATAPMKATKVLNKVGIDAKPLNDGLMDGFQTAGDAMDIVGGAGMVVGGVSDAVIKGTKLKENWSHMKWLDRAEAGLDVAAAGGKALGGTGKMIRGAGRISNKWNDDMLKQAKTPLERYGGITTMFASGFGVLKNGLGMVNQGRQLHKYRKKEKALRKGKGFHKDKKKNETAFDARVRSENEAGKKAMEEVVANGGSNAEGQKAFLAAIDEQRKKNIHHDTKSIANKMSKTSRKDKLLRAIGGFGVNALKFTGKMMNYTDTGKSFGLGHILTIAATGLDFATGLIFDHIQEKDTRKLIDKQLVLLKETDPDLALKLPGINNYDDLKKYFKFEYVKAISQMKDDKKGKKKQLLLDVNDLDFKTAMSMSLSGMGGGKRGLRNAMTLGQAGAMRKDVKEMDSRGVNVDNGTDFSDEVIAETMGYSTEKATGEYTLAEDAVRRREKLDELYKKDAGDAGESAAPNQVKLKMPPLPAHIPAYYMDRSKRWNAALDEMRAKRAGRPLPPARPPVLPPRQNQVIPPPPAMAPVLPPRQNQVIPPPVPPRKT